MTIVNPNTRIDNENSEQLPTFADIAIDKTFLTLNDPDDQVVSSISRRLANMFFRKPGRVEPPL